MYRNTIYKKYLNLNSNLNWIYKLLIYKFWVSKLQMYKLEVYKLQVNKFTKIGKQVEEMGSIAPPTKSFVSHKATSPRPLVSQAEFSSKLFLQTFNFSITSKLFYTHKLLIFPTHHPNFNQISNFQHELNTPLIPEPQPRERAEQCARLPAKMAERQGPSGAHERQAHGPEIKETNFI